MNYSKIPFNLPFKFARLQYSGFAHFDDVIACMQTRKWQLKRKYYQKWVSGKTTRLQVESTVFPEPLKLVNVETGLVVNEYAWTKMIDAGGYSIYETEFNTVDVPNGYYMLYYNASFLESFKFESISNPFKIVSSEEGLINIVYANSYNVDDVVFTTGIKFSMFVEGDVNETEFMSDMDTYKNERSAVINLSGTAYRQPQLLIGNARGVYPYIMDIINRAFTYDFTEISGKRFVKKDGAEIKLNQQKGYPLVGGSLELLEYGNPTSLQFAADNDGNPINEFIVAYNMETDAISGPNIVSIIDFE